MIRIKIEIIFSGMKILPIKNQMGIKKRGLTQEESDLFVRRDRDSNPGNLSVQRFSRPPQSTTLPPLQGVVFESLVGIAIPFSITGAKVGIILKPANFWLIFLRFLPKKGWSYPMSPSLLSLFRYYFPNSSTNWFGSFQTFSRVRNSL